MKQRLDKHYGRYGHRWQAETGFSMFKRRLSSTVNGRSYWSQCRDLLLMAICDTPAHRGANKVMDTPAHRRVERLLQTPAACTGCGVYLFHKRNPQRFTPRPSR